MLFLNSQIVKATVTTIDGANYPPNGVVVWNPGNTSQQPYFNDDIHLINGATLQIETFIVYVDGSIIVEPGCHLIIDDYGATGISGKIILKTDPAGIVQGATLETDGGSFLPYDTYEIWDGIEVWGMNNNGSGINQDKSAKATLSQAYIGYAKVGIANCKDPGSSNIFSRWAGSNTGGIIQLDHCSFGYNNCSIFMTNQICYENGILLNDQSYINNYCWFLGGAAFSPLPGSNDQFWGTDVFLANVVGIRIRNSWFQSPNNRLAINAFAGFSVTDNCTFDNYSRTIVGSCPNYLAGAIIKDATFTNCIWNIELNGYALPAVHANTIINNGASFPNYPYRFQGIYLANCPGMYVEGNTVELSNYGGWTPSSSNGPALGMVINNAGASPNDAYRNSFTNMDYAMESIGENRMDPSAGFGGLRFLCNTFNTSNGISYDIISGPQGYPGSLGYYNTTGMDRFQHLGSTSNEYAAGNLFNTFTTTNPSHFDNALVSDPNHEINYYYNSALSRQEPINTNIPSLNLQDITQYTECSPRNNPAGVSGNSTDFINNLPSVSSSNDAGEMKVYAEYVNDRLRGFLYGDASAIPLDEMEVALNQTAYIYDYKLVLAKVYAAQGRWQDAANLVDGLHNTYTMNSDEQDWMNHIQAIYETEKALEDEDGDWNAIDGGLRSAVDNIAGSDGYFARDMAKLLQMAYDGGSGPEPEYIWEDGSSFKQAPTAVQQVQGTYSYIYPNPANDILYINNKGNATMQVSDVAGRVILSVAVQEGINSIDIHQLARGMYFVNLYNSGNELTSVTKLSKQ